MKLFVLVPGFGHPHVDLKRHILISNLSLLSTFPGKVDVLVCHYSTDVDLALPPTSYNNHHLGINIIKEPGIVAQFIHRHAEPVALASQGYTHVMLLLDDVQLNPRDFSWPTALTYLHDFHLDVLSPSLTHDSKYVFPWMLTHIQDGTHLHIVPCCELFCYLLPMASFARYYAYLDPENNPWNWGLDMMLHKVCDLRVGIANDLTMKHYLVTQNHGTASSSPTSASASASSTHNPFDQVVTYLKKYGQTRELLSHQPTWFYKITRSA
jgi:hypothetical protein